MSLILMALGMILIVTGYEGTGGQLVTQLGTDVPGYAPWALALILAGALGYAEDFRGVSNALLALFLLVLIAGHSGIWGQLQQLASSPPTPATPPPLVSDADKAALAKGPNITVTLGGGSSKGGAAGAAGSAIGGLPGLGSIVSGIASIFG